ncbi:hypothetical protein ACFX2I_046863 [Malus domestica]
MTPTQVSDEETNLFAMQLANALTLHMVLKTALELDLLEIMTKAGPGAFFSLANLASQLPTKNPNIPVMLDRMLRLLANYSIFTYSICTLPNGNVKRLYDLDPVYKFLTKNKRCDPGAHLADILSPKDHEVLLQEKKLLDLPTLLSEWGKDCCCLWWSFNFSAGKVSPPTTIHRRR